MKYAQQLPNSNFTLSLPLLSFLVLFGFLLAFYTGSPAAFAQSGEQQRVLLLDMKMPILPGTMGYLESGIEVAERESYDLIVVRLSTPGGMLNTTQEMIQMIFESPVPIAVYVDPAGASATSAGVFITMAAHVAAMAPGTSIGAAHPVSGEGKDIDGDMRQKVENMASAMMKSISNRRGRNAEWAVKAVKESVSITAEEAVSSGVVDIKAVDLDELLKKIEGRVVQINGAAVTLPSFSDSQIEVFGLSFRYTVLNFLANPSVAAILWLVATTGIGVELYNPGLILPGVAGALCLVLALISMQVLPLSEGAIVLLVVGVLMIIAEGYVTSGLLGIGGILAILVGLVYFVDTTASPTLQLQLSLIVPTLLMLATLMGAAVWTILSSRKRTALTGFAGLLGQLGEALEDFDAEGRVLVAGESWQASSTDKILKGDRVRVVGRGIGLVLDVKVVPQTSETEKEC